MIQNKHERWRYCSTRVLGTFVIRVPCITLCQSICFFCEDSKLTLLRQPRVSTGLPSVTKCLPLCSSRLTFCPSAFTRLCNSPGMQNEIGSQIAMVCAVTSQVQIISYVKLGSGKVANCRQQKGCKFNGVYFFLKPCLYTGNMLGRYQQTRIR